MATALITGITGQDGSCLAELLFARGYDVGAIVRRKAIEGIADEMEHKEIAFLGSME